MMDNDLVESDALLEAIFSELATDEFEYLAQLQSIDELSAQLTSLNGIHNALVDFENRLKAVEDLLTEVKRDIGAFVYGHMYSAVVGAYECFMHDILDVLVDHDFFFRSAIKAILVKDKNGLDSEKHITLRKITGLRKTPTKANLKALLHSATLIDPKKIAYSIHQWFDVSIPPPEGIERVTQLRNLFSHNGGKRSDGSRESMDSAGVLELISQLDKLAAASSEQVSLAIAQLVEQETLR